VRDWGQESRTRHQAIVGEGVVQNDGRLQKASDTRLRTIVELIQSAMLTATFILSALLASQCALVCPRWIPASADDRARQLQTTQAYASDTVNRTRALVDQIIAASYPDLKDADIRIKSFRSRSDYFKARFGFSQYFFTRM